MKNKKTISVAVLLLSIGLIVAVICAAVILPRFLKDKNPAAHAQQEQLQDSDETKTYTVAFVDTSGVLLKEEQVEENKSAVPPEDFVPAEDKFFVGWDQNFSSVASNMLIHPEYQTISDIPNCVYGNAVYAKPNDEICVRVKLGGQVNLAALQMYINYDENALQYIDGVNCDAGVMINKDAEKAQIRLAFLADDNVTGTVDFVDLIFKVKDTSAEKTTITYDVEKIAQISANEEIILAESTTKDTSIYLY